MEHNIVTGLIEKTEMQVRFSFRPTGVSARPVHLLLA